MCNKKLKVPQLRFPEYSGEWEEKKLGEVVTINSGKDYKHLASGHYPVYGTGGYMTSVAEFLSSEDAIGIGRKGTINKPYLLKAPFWTVDTLFYCIPQNNNQLLFLLNIFKTIKWDRYDESTGVPSLSKATINKIMTKLPNKKEQQKIGHFLFKIDHQIDLAQKALDFIKQQKQGYMQKIFSRELRFKDDGGNDYPEWGITKMEEIAQISKGFTPSTKVEEYWDKDEKNWLSIAGMNSKYVYEGNKGVTKKGSQSHNKVARNTLIMSFKLTIGKLGIIKIPLYTNEAICHFNFKNEEIDTEYMYYFLSCINVASFGSRAVKGITLNNESINSIVIKFPCLKEQQKIGQFFTQFDDLIDKQSRKLELLHQRQQALLQQMFV